MTLAPVIICGLLGFLTVLLVAPLTLRLSGASSRAPDLHHTHHGVVPRFGGLALVSALVAVELLIQWWFPQERVRLPGRMVVVLSSLAMFGLGFWDDFKPLGAKRKLAGQILIALGVYYAGVGIETFKIPFSERIIGET